LTPEKRVKVVVSKRLHEYRCVECGEWFMPKRERLDLRYCKVRCRVAAYRKRRAALAARGEEGQR